VKTNVVNNDVQSVGGGNVKSGEG